MENNFFARAIDFLFPLSCAGCGKFLGESARCAGMESWCVRCDSASQTEPQIKLCENELKIFSARKYDSPPIVHAIEILKYRGVWDVASVCAWWMWPIFEKINTDCVVLVPVPLHVRRLRERGFNQSELIARALSERFLCSIDCGILYRTKYTRQQAKSSREERTEQMSGAFCATALCDPGALYILIDDVVTTGSTLEACAAALHAAGVRHIIACTAAAA